LEQLKQTVILIEKSVAEEQTNGETLYEEPPIEAHLTLNLKTLL